MHVTRCKKNLLTLDATRGQKRSKRGQSIKLWKMHTEIQFFAYILILYPKAT